MDGPVEVIRMQSRPGEGDPCVACGEPSSGYHALPVFNGDIVSNDWPGEWGGKPCCEECYEAHLEGRMPCADRLYTAYLDRLRTFTDGGGI